MDHTNMFRKKNLKEQCPGIEELITFVLGVRKSSFIHDHLRECEICEDLAGGIEVLKKEHEDITPAELYQQLITKDEAYLNTLKFPENHDDMIGKLSQKLDLPETIEKRIRDILEDPSDEIFMPKDDN